MTPNEPYGILTLEVLDAHGIVHLPRYLRDESWANSMGAIQEAIAPQKLGGTASLNQLTFDFVPCRWIDPLPLMSILIEIKHAVASGLRVRIVLPKADDGPDPLEVGPYQTSPNRLLWFLDQEGFLDHIEQLSKSHALEYPQVDERNDYRELRITPSYEDSRCIPMRLFTVPRESDGPAFAQQTVEDLLVGIDTRLEARTSPQTRERLTYKLRVALQEAMHNVQEHAYDGLESPRLLAVYVRCRTGGLRLDAASRSTFEAHGREERAHCPGVDSDWLAARPGCLEIFILDRGMGMVRRFEQSKGPLPGKYKFNEVMAATFVDGQSSKPERQTRFGGLHLLHNLLSDTGDYIRALEEGTWFAAAAPLVRREKQTHRLTQGQATLRGLAMHLRLGWKTEADDDERWAQFEQGEHSEVWPELCLDEQACASSMRWFGEQAVVDERFGRSVEQGGQADWVLWLVRPHRMKWDILSFLKRRLTSHAREGATLVIADIPSYEAETYAAALADLKLACDEQWPSRFSRIILCTNRWRFAAVEYERRGSRHGYSDLRRNLAEMRIGAPPLEPRPANFRLAVVRWLKWHDSQILWTEVSQQRSMFIPEPILWGQDAYGQPRVISGYLDFSQSARDTLCGALYRAALARVLGVMPSQMVQMRPLDQLTRTVLRDIHSMEIYEPAKRAPSTQLTLGSVLVSGSTLDASVTQCLDLHFFVHRSSPLRSKKPSLLFWMPLREVEDRPPRLMRIGKTASIGPEGWKSFEVPRFDAEGMCVGARNPQQTYRDWQSPSPVIVKPGHWSYEGHHDFLAVNTAGAVEAAFLEKNDLAKFLLNRILPFLGLGEVHVQKAWHRLLRPRQERDEHRTCEDGDYGLLVYRSHPSSELIIGKVLEVLTAEGRAIARKRMFPIVPVRVHWGGSALLIPPLDRNDIRAALCAEDRTRAVLIFDDAAVSGRTLNDLRAALSAIGATEISSLVITNRLRQPADAGGAGAVEYFWRLDLPVMGREGTCPLCHALNLVHEFSARLASENAKNEIKEWLLRWAAVSPLDDWSRGLRPLPLSNPQRNKSYCHRQDRSGQGRYLAQIDVVRSTGLAIHISELHAMTGRDDYCLKKIAEHRDPEVRIEIGASQLLLFGNEFDVDTRVKLTQVLLQELAHLENGSAHTQLGCLVAMESLRQLTPGAKRQVVAAVDPETWAANRNYAIKILLAYLVQCGLLDQKTDAHTMGERLLSTAPLTHSEKFRALFLETLSPEGNPHSEALPILLEELRAKGEVKEKGLIRNALDSLDRMEELINGLEKLLVRKDARFGYAARLTDWKETSSAVSGMLREYSNEKADRIVRELDKYLRETRSLASAYFHCIAPAQKYCDRRTFETEVLSKIINEINWERASAGKWTQVGSPVGSQKREVRISPTGRIKFGPKAFEVWIAWYQGIPGIVLDLIRNAVYASETIIDPWNPTGGQVADMWIRVDYEPREVSLTLINKSDISETGMGLHSNAERWLVLKGIGGAVEPVEVERGMIGMRVRIPYAAYLK
ncbi:hypothetical protein JM946_13900 [Steroidobacter sp. S1-65]|uniref:ATP-binding protein n=1 Tax=Steroidobacter gossypii TaxID=2805490 RepID=A0ABS1WXX2_9GAMM|nr:hypothetical protein [Steroidobacter gossypii]MBM0105829.1 hypothetical protein [Steroidobacter gossypii]